MKAYKTCPLCGAHLDCGEICDCEKINKDEMEEPENGDQERLHTLHHSDGGDPLPGKQCQL